MTQQPPSAAAVPTDATSDIAARFAPPEARVEAIAPEHTQAQGQAMWFQVSPLKLAVMCTVTLQFYGIYWLYRQWKLVRDREKSSLMPAMRAIFGVIFFWALCDRVRSSQLAAGVAAKDALNAGGIAAAWIVFTLMWKAPDPVWWVALLASLFLMPVQAAMNAVNDAVSPGQPRNDRFSVWNWIAIVLGSLFIVMALIGTFMPGPA
jgi:hypothetical protein